MLCILRALGPGGYPRRARWMRIIPVMSGLLLAPAAAQADTWADCMQHDDFRKKLVACTKVIDAENTDSRDRTTALLHRAFGRRMTKAYDGAEEDVERVIKVSPNWGHAYYERGMLKLVREDLYAALRNFDNAVRFMTDKPFVWVERGRTNYLLGNDWAAAQDLGEALRIDPSVTRALDFRGRAYCRQDRGDSALADWQRLRSLDPDAAERQRGWVVDFAQAGTLSEEQLATALDQFVKAGCPGL